MHTHRMIGRAKAVTETAPNTTGSNEADTNADTCCFGQNLIPTAYKNRLSYVYPNSEVYETIENVHIVSRDTSYDHTDGNT